MTQEKHDRSDDEQARPPSEGRELAPTASAAEKQFEIQSAIAIAKKCPRNEATAFQKLMKAACRPSFAEEATYSFPRATTTVTGPSVNIAREAARVWENFRYGVYVIREDDQTRLIRGWAWDVETNVQVQAEDEFAKLIYRKGKGWIEADERELRELTNRRGAILVRNCILQLLPKDLIEDALDRCAQTRQKGAADDPEYAKKKVVVNFSDVGVTVAQLETYLKHPMGQCTPVELANLQTLYRSIVDGNSRWSDYVGPVDAPDSDDLAKVQQGLREQTEAPDDPPSPAKEATPTKPPKAAKQTVPSPFEDDEAWEQTCRELQEAHYEAFIAVKKKQGIPNVFKIAVANRKKFYDAVKGAVKGA
jgi:hypothetical protein